MSRKKKSQLVKPKAKAKQITVTPCPQEIRRKNKEEANVPRKQKKEKKH